MVTWNTIECIERNGIITGYTVVFQQQGGANVPGNTVDRIFSATAGLTPFTNYIFQVAGVNGVGNGVFAVLTITTDEEGLHINFESGDFISLLTVPGPVSDITARPEVTSVVLTWSVPQEPNGIIIAYEVTYSIDGSAITVVNSTNGATTLTTPSLPPNTNISSISVTAYTSIGRGESVSHDVVITPAVPTLCE